MIFVLKKHDIVIFATADYREAFESVINQDTQCEVYNGRTRYALLKKSHSKIIFDECYVVSELTDLVIGYNKKEVRLSDLKTGDRFIFWDDEYTLLATHGKLSLYSLEKACTLKYLYVDKYNCVYGTNDDSIVKKV